MEKIGEKIVRLVRGVNTAFCAWQGREEMLEGLPRAEHLKVRPVMEL